MARGCKTARGGVQAELSAIFKGELGGLGFRV